ncbi:tyrosine-type recombinase/integrase [Fimbriiglobus ruber]|uniref:Tyr recombinase domain-containing protein n=1 Tax=Fimbriiglobus ruber TaxID=1908690 RepID=A0A225EGH0_9BACT|nr:site-specific integrase [Fimbriiglobus ruber]OWK47317.1 hypothetical protein FRUB_01016 [Fimbriiglobus ruber]
MATLQIRNGSFRILFRYLGRRHTFTIGRVAKREAELLAANVDRILLRVEQRLLTVPPGIDIVEFVRSDGTLKTPEAAIEEFTFAAVRDGYVEAHATGAVEANTLATTRIHLNHLGKTLGDQFLMRSLSLADVQRHIDRRLASRHHGRPIGPQTVRKEVSTLGAIWTWAETRGMVSNRFPSRGLIYPKTDEKSPFMTLQEIERRVVAGGLTEAEQESLYESLYLRREEIDSFLAHVRQHAAHPFIYPLICTAAHTGARRSELLRVEITDLDLVSGTLLVREKKRSKKQRTTRHVSLTPFLSEVLKDWLAIHPGGRYLFGRSGIVARSRKRSATTGHQSGKDREKTLKGRHATVRPRGDVENAPLTKDEAHDHFKRTLAGSRWEVLRGFHVLRHSFISCLAAAGVDQRIIDDFVGHSTPEQQRRYRHLIPDVKQKAIANAFG